MALLSVSGLSKAYGADTIFSGVSFEVQEKNRIGLVGVNGSGKTTLFRLLTGEEKPDAGEIHRSKMLSVGYMEQHVCSDPQRSAYEEVLRVFSELLEMEHELDVVTTLLSGNPADRNALIERQVFLTEQFERLGGMTFRSRTRSALLGLGFSEDSMKLPVGVLSGGQRAKLQLAKMLLSGANLLLLDEPTNHLDIPSVEWLEEFLRGYPGAFLVISHDRYFLDAVTERTFILQNERLTGYKGNYTVAYAQKKEQDLAAQRKYENTQREISRLEGVVAQQLQFNREKSVRQAESHQKAIDRLQKTLVRPDSAEKELRFQFASGRRSGDEVLSAEGLALSFDGKQLFQNANMEIRRGERVFLLGPNGCGKTSFLKILLGAYAPDCGEVRFGAGVDLGYYDQIQSDLDGTKTVLDEIWDAYPQKTEMEIRSALAMFLFRGEEVFKQVSALSGGERARVLLLRLMLSKANFLLLDEPTNHLDISSCEALENALQDYPGTLLMISHDRYFINKLADRIYVLNSDGTTAYEGRYDDYLAKRKEDADLQKQAAPSAKCNSSNKRRREKEAELKKQRIALSRLEKQIQATEEEIESVEAALNAPETVSDYQATLELSNQLALLNAQNDDQLAQWAELSEAVETAQEELSLIL